MTLLGKAILPYITKKNAIPKYVNNEPREV